MVLYILVMDSLSSKERKVSSVQTQGCCFARELSLVFRVIWPGCCRGAGLLSHIWQLGPNTGSSCLCTGCQLKGCALFGGEVRAKSRYVMK